MERAVAQTRMRPSVADWRWRSWGGALGKNQAPISLGRDGTKARCSTGSGREEGQIHRSIRSRRMATPNATQSGARHVPATLAIGDATPPKNLPHGLGVEVGVEAAGRD
jgi:hypothetical protein